MRHSRRQFGSSCTDIVQQGHEVLWNLGWCWLLNDPDSDSVHTLRRRAGGGVVAHSALVPTHVDTQAGTPFLSGEQSDDPSILTVC